MERDKNNIAIAGGPCTGKSTLAAILFARLKIDGWDYDLIGEEKRKLAKEFGAYQSPFERLYIWRQQEREELRSTAVDGFITDTPLFHLYVSARMYSKTPRDLLAVRELFRMCLEIEDRYQLIVIAQNPQEIQYKNDQARQGGESHSIKIHQLLRSFLEHLLSEKLILVQGSLEQRLNQVLGKLEELR